MALWNSGIKGYRLHFKKTPGKPDIAFIKKKVSVFVHGCFWHRRPHCNPTFPKSNIDFWKEKFDTNIKRDITKRNDLATIGWKVVEIWECQINRNLREQVERINQFL